MAKLMTKSKILDYLSKKLGLTKKKVAEILDEIVGLAYKEAKNSFTLPGMGKLVVVNRKARMGRNPQTGCAGFATVPWRDERGRAGILSRCSSLGHIR